MMEEQPPYGPRDRTPIPGKAHAVARALAALAASAILATALAGPTAAAGVGCPYKLAESLERLNEGATGANRLVDDVIRYSEALNNLRRESILPENLTECQPGFVQRAETLAGQLAVSRFDGLQGISGILSDCGDHFERRISNDLDKARRQSDANSVIRLSRIRVDITQLVTGAVSLAQTSESLESKGARLKRETGNLLEQCVGRSELGKY